MRRPTCRPTTRRRGSKRHAIFLRAGFRTFAYLGGVTVEGYGKAPDTLDLDSASVRTAVVKTAQRLVEEGEFGGLHYDIEPLGKSLDPFLLLLEETRPALKGRPLSVAVPCTWHRTSMELVARRCDQVTLMAYDLTYPTGAAYQDGLAQLVPAMCRILYGTGCKLVVGCPTYDEKTRDHDPAVENVENCVPGVLRGLRAAEDTTPFQGLGVYAQWTTSEQDWAQFEKLWL